MSAQSRLVRRAGLQDTLSGAASAIACVSSREQYPSKQLFSTSGSTLCKNSASRGQFHHECTLYSSSDLSHAHERETCLYQETQSKGSGVFMHNYNEVMNKKQGVICLPQETELLRKRVD